MQIYVRAVQFSVEFPEQNSQIAAVIELLKLLKFAEVFETVG
jgi:hypothetical protein